MGQSVRSASSGRLRVLVAGGGVAGLEAMVALRDLAGDLVDVELLSPDPWFWYRPISVAEPLDSSRAYRFELSGLARAAGASFSSGSLVGVDAKGHQARLSNGLEVGYDVLVIAAGTRAAVALEGALTFRGSADVEAFRSILTEVEAGQAKRIAFTLPRRAGWPLPLYELALLTAAHVLARGLEGVELSLVTHEKAPLGLLGAAASDAVRGLLEQFRGSDCTPAATRCRSRRDVWNSPGSSLAVDRVVAPARLEEGSRSRESRTTATGSSPPRSG